MKQRKIGSLTAGEIGLGCMSMSQSYGKPDEEGGIEAIQRAVELGMNLIDTAEGYGLGKNEELVGRAIKGRRDKVVISTKTAGGKRLLDPEQKLSQADYVKIAIDGTLKRLQVDHVDLYYIHRVNPKDSIEDTIGALARLVEAGKVREIGLSEASVETTRRAHAVHPIAAMQNEYSLWTRDPEETGMLALCRELGITLVPFSPLGRGFFTGTVTRVDNFESDDMRRDMPRFQSENFSRNQFLLDTVKAVADEAGCTPGQVSLAWLLAQGPDIVPIPGTKRKKYVEENAGASDVTLTPAMLARLASAFTPEHIAGARYPEALMRRVGG